MNVLTNEIVEEIEKMTYQFFADEWEVDISELTAETDVINDLDGDSLMLLELIEQIKKKYNLTIKMQTLGKYILKHPATTIDSIIKVCCRLYEKEDDMVEE